MLYDPHTIRLKTRPLLPAAAVQQPSATAWLLLAGFALAMLFRFSPQIDLWVSALAFDVERGFFLKDAAPVRLVYWLFRELPYILVPLLAWLWLASRRWRGARERTLRRSLVFLLITLALGPGLMVNEVLKNHTGRARPAQVVEFGGERTFTPAFVLADQCDRNCSFVSGHASMGFFFLAFAWVFRDRRWLWFGLLAGGLVGAGRILQGAHFLSDVVFSYFVVHLCTLLCARLILGRWSIAPSPLRSAS